MKFSLMIHLVDYYGTRPLEDKTPIYKIYTFMRRQLIDYYGTRPEKRQHLKKSYSSTRWKLRKRHDLYIHTRWSTMESSYKKNIPNHRPKNSYLHGKEKIQYILLIYQLHNLVGHRLRLLYKLDKLVMVTSRTHAIAKDTYPSPRLV